MKKVVKCLNTCFVLCIMFALIVAMTGCSSNSTASSNATLPDSNGDSKQTETVSQDSTATSPAMSKESSSETASVTSAYADDTIKIEDIDWKVGEGLIDDQRIIEFSYTNNSKYTITDVEMQFDLKEGTTQDQLAVFNDLKEKNNWTDDQVSKIYILGYNRKFADPGETVGKSPCVINGTYTLVENMEQYQLMEPSMATIAFIGDDEMMHAEYYDFKSKAYSASSKGAMEMNQWSESEISGQLPKPDLKVVMVVTDEDDKFSFTTYGTSSEEYEAYTKACQDKGFTSDESNGNNYFSAANSSGYKVNVSYNAVEESMDVRIEKG